MYLYNRLEKNVQILQNGNSSLTNFTFIQGNMDEIKNVKQKTICNKKHVFFQCFNKSSSRNCH